jgi:hypothetical protein
MQSNNKKNKEKGYGLERAVISNGYFEEAVTFKDTNKGSRFS